MQPNGPPGLPPADGRPAFLRQYRWRSWSRCCRCWHKARCSGIGSCFPHKLGNIDAIAEQCRVPSARIGRGPSNVEVLLRRSTHNQCGVDGRGQDYFFSNIKNIAGVGENLREDASFRWPGKCRISAALRSCEASAVSDPKGRVYYWGEHRPRSHGARVQERNIAEWNWSRLDAGGLSSDHASSRTMCTMRCVHSLAWRYCLGAAGSWIWFSGRVTRPGSQTRRNLDAGLPGSG